MGWQTKPSGKLMIQPARESMMRGRICRNHIETGAESHCKAIPELFARFSPTRLFRHIAGFNSIKILIKPAWQNYKLQNDVHLAEIPIAVDSNLYMDEVSNSIPMRLSTAILCCINVRSGL
jgi:hypothetical protein